MKLRNTYDYWWDLDVDREVFEQLCKKRVIGWVNRRPVFETDDIDWDAVCDIAEGVLASQGAIETESLVRRKKKSK